MAPTSSGINCAASFVPNGADRDRSNAVNMLKIDNKQNQRHSEKHNPHLITVKPSFIYKPNSISDI